MACIYKFENLITKEIYIGSTELPETRRQQYEKFYRTSLSKTVVESIERDGIENHRWEVIVDIPHPITAVQLHRLEDIFILGYHEAGFRMLNYGKIKRRPRYKLQHDRKKGITNQKIKKLACEKSKKLYTSKKIPIIQVDGEGNMMKEWESITDCANELTMCVSTLYDKLKKGNEFRRKYDSRKVSTHKYSFINKPVYQLNFHDEVINEFESLKEASEKTKVNLFNISSACRGRLKTAGGYRWKYKNQ